MALILFCPWHLYSPVADRFHAHFLFYVVDVISINRHCSRRKMFSSHLFIYHLWRGGEGVLQSIASLGLCNLNV